MTWAVGLSTAAQAHVDRALALDPLNPLATVLAGMLQHGRLPEWIYAAHTAMHRSVREQRPA